MKKRMRHMPIENAGARKLSVEIVEEGQDLSADVNVNIF